MTKYQKFVLWDVKKQQDEVKKAEHLAGLKLHFKSFGASRNCCSTNQSAARLDSIHFDEVGCGKKSALSL